MTILCRSAVAVAALAAVALAPASAAPSASGPTKFVVTDCANASLAVRFTSEEAPLALRSGDITSDDRPELPIPWSISWEKPQASDPSIKEYQASGTVKGGCPARGTYTVPLSVTLGGPKPSAAVFSIKLVRAVDPVLDAPSAVTLTASRWPVYDFGVSLPSIRLRETSHGSAIDSISASGRELKTSSGELTDIALNPDPKPLSVPAGGAADLSLQLSRTPDPGTYTTRLVLHGAALKQDQGADVTLKVRVFWIFLLIAIALGIGLGWFVNVGLAQSAALDAAILAGIRAASLLARRATAQKDPLVQQRLIALASVLESRVRTAEDPDAAQKLVAEAQGQATKVEEAALASAADFAQSVARVRAVLAPNHLIAPPSVAAELAALNDALGGIERVAQAGNIERALEKLRPFEQTLPRAVLGKLQGWLRDMRLALDELGPWVEPAQELEKDRVKLANAVQEAYSTGDAAELVKKCVAVERDLSGMLVFSAPRGIARAFRAAAAELRKGEREDLADQVSAAADDVEHVDFGRLEARAALRELAKIRRKVESLVRSQARGKSDVEACLLKGDYPGATAALLGKPQAASALAADLQAAAPLAELQYSSTPLPAAAVASINPVVRVPPNLELEKEQHVTLDWAGENPNVAAPRWSCDPPDAAVTSNEDVQGANVLPKKAGYLTISVDLGGGRSSSATSYVGDVTQASIYQQIKQRRERVNFWTGVVAALLTAFAGYQIFIGSWFGTFADFLSAFVWGFFGQFGLDRLKEIARPITSRTLT